MYIEKGGKEEGGGRGRGKREGEEGGGRGRGKRKPDVGHVNAQVSVHEIETVWQLNNLIASSKQP